MAAAISQPIKKIVLHLRFWLAASFSLLSADRAEQQNDR